LGNTNEYFFTFDFWGGSLPVGLLETGLLGRGNLGGIDQVGVSVNLDLRDDVLKMASAASSGGTTALSLQGPCVLTDTRGGSKTAGSASSLLVVEGARSAASADSVGLDVLSTTKARGTLSLYSWNSKVLKKTTKKTRVSPCFCLPVHSNSIE
jgi:hypothetical protein